MRPSLLHDVHARVVAEGPRYPLGQFPGDGPKRVSIQTADWQDGHAGRCNERLRCPLQFGQVHGAALYVRAKVLSQTQHDSPRDAAQHRLIRCGHEHAINYEENIRGCAFGDIVADIAEEGEDISGVDADLDGPQSQEQAALRLDPWIDAAGGRHLQRWDREFHATIGQVGEMGECNGTTGDQDCGWTWHDAAVWRSVRAPRHPVDQRYVVIGA